VTEGGDGLSVVEEEELEGLAGVRTDLAWGRSGLAGVAAIAALLKRTIDGFDIEEVSEVVLVLLMGIAVVWSASVVYASVFSDATRHPRRPVDETRVRRIAYGTTLFAVAAGALALAG
jgi:uncharacterized membrane protein YidH (DUF202 family)